MSQMTPPTKSSDKERPEGNRTRKEPEGGKKGFRIPIWYLLGGIALLLLIRWAVSGMDRKEIGYGEFRKLLKAGKVQSLVLRSEKIEGELKAEKAGGEPRKFATTKVKNDDELVNLLDEHGVNYRVESDWLQNVLLFWILPIGLIIILWKFLFSRMGPAGGAMQFGQSRARMIMQKDIEVTFDDVAGIDESKQELQEVIEFLKNPKRFTRLGGKIPKGVLLVGPPGTGKTLLGKAVAGEAGVVFFSLSGSDFVEMFVGVGAARVRDLFEQANRNAPCIIFIDELDALGKTRGAGVMGGHDEREQTLNALLVQMDGIQSARGVIILAATNRPEMLDPALLRPGRFDRHIVVSPPDLKGREEILRVHVRTLRLAQSVDLHKIAAMTPGFVGADLANLANEAALLAARRGKKQVEHEDFEDSVERVVAGLEKRNRLINEEEKKVIAHHESGHALAASLLPGADPVRKVSMIPRGPAALGYTMQMPLEDRYLLRKGELIDRLTVMLGGRVAEEIAFNEVSTGARDDLQKASDLAREMVTRYGMSEELGPIALPLEDLPSFWGEGIAHRPWSEQTNIEADRAIRNLLDKAHRRCRELLTEHKDALMKLAAELMDKEVLTEAELRQTLGEFGIKLPERSYEAREQAQADEKVRQEAASAAPEDPLPGQAPSIADPPEEPG